MECRKDPGIIPVSSVGRPPHLGSAVISQSSKFEPSSRKVKMLVSNCDTHQLFPFCWPLGVQTDDSEPLSIHCRPQSIWKWIASIQSNNQSGYKTIFWGSASARLSCLVDVIFGLLLFWFVCARFFSLLKLYREKIVSCIDDDAGRNAAPKTPNFEIEIEVELLLYEEKRVAITLAYQTYHHAKRAQRAIVYFTGVVVVAAAVGLEAPALVGNCCAWLTGVKPQTNIAFEKRSNELRK